MSIEKLWINKIDSGHNFVFYDGDTIYRKKAKGLKFDQIEKELSNGIINKNIVGVPIAYLKEVQFREHDPKIKLKYGRDSEEEIEIPDIEMRKDIFNFLKDNTPVASIDQSKPAVLRRIKKPLIALVLVLGIFLYVLSIVNGMQMGYQYETVGGKPGLAGIILVLANLGYFKNILIFGTLAFIAIWRIVKNYKDDNEVYSLKY